MSYSLTDRRSGVKPSGAPENYVPPARCYDDEEPETLAAQLYRIASMARRARTMKEGGR